MNHIEPLNFLRKAGQSLDSLLPRMNLPDTYKQTARRVIDLANASEKFVIPINGRIFDDGLRGLPAEFKLPFESVVIEYQCKANGGLVEEYFGSTKTNEARNRIVVAYQDGDQIIVFSLIFSFIGEGVVDWYMQPYYSTLSIASDVHKELVKDDELLSSLKVTQIESVVVQQSDIGGVARSSHGEDWETHARLNMTDEVNCVLELIEALSCSNVSSEELTPRKLNKSASKRGALPFDTYRILTIKPSVRGVGASSGEHRSPREHLRRGHIRRLEEKTVWVNSAVVNAGTVGRVTKEYRVSA